MVSLILPGGARLSRRGQPRSSQISQIHSSQAKACPILQAGTRVKQVKLVWRRSAITGHQCADELAPTQPDSAGDRPGNRQRKRTGSPSYTRASTHKGRRFMPTHAHVFAKEKYQKRRSKEVPVAVYTRGPTERKEIYVFAYTCIYGREIPRKWSF